MMTKRRHANTSWFSATMGRWAFLRIVVLVALAAPVGCGVDPDVDGVMAGGADTVDDDTSDVGDSGSDADATPSDVSDVSDDGQEDMGEDITDGSDGDAALPDVTPVTCNGHCDCDESEFCSNTGTCQPIVGPDIYYCCEDTGPACPEGQACHVPGTFGNSGTCGD